MARMAGDSAGRRGGESVSEPAPGGSPPARDVGPLQSPPLGLPVHLALPPLPAACLPLTFWIGSRWPGAGRWLRVAIVLFLLLRLPEIVVIGFGHRTYHLDSDVATRLTVRQQALLPEEYRPKAAE